MDVILMALPLANSFIPPDRPTPLRVDWVAVALFVGWIVSLVFAFGWYRKWGGRTSDAFTAVASLGLLLPPAAVANQNGICSTLVWAM